MLYVLIDGEYVVNGPREWNAKSFQNTLSDDYEINYVLPMQKEDFGIIVINDTLRILPASLTYPEYNSKIEYCDGPYWNYENNFAAGSFQVKDQPIDSVKANLKQIIAANRYNKEVAGTKTTIQELEVFIDTSRTNRNTYVNAYNLMADTDTVNWKFAEGWLVLTKEEMSNVVTTGSNYINAQFDWELSKVDEINNCTTLEELNNVDLGYPVPPQPTLV
jgi:hypothetical protein